MIENASLSNENPTLVKKSLIALTVFLPLEESKGCNEN